MPLVTMGQQYGKLKTNLRLAVNRLKLLEKKKTEMAQKSRKEIAEYIAGNKEDRARIRVEHIVREDYIVEAYELLEMYCDMLLARFGLIQQMKEMDEGIEEAVNSLIWAAPRVLTDVQEFKVISDQLTAKYGKPFAEACRQNQFNKVNGKLVHKLGVQAPPKVLVEKYMIEIAKSHNVPFVPDPNVMREDEVAAAEAMLIDFQNQGQRGGGWMYPQAGGGQQPPPPPPGMIGFPPPPPGGASGGGSGGGGGGMVAPSQPFSYPTIGQDQAPPPTYDSQTNSSTQKAAEAGELPAKVRPNSQPTAPPPAAFTLPQLPDPPADFDDEPAQPPPPPAAGDDELDFDDLNRRFEDLKKRR